MAKRDIQLVELLLVHLNSLNKSDYRVTALPEAEDRTRKAVEAIATDSKGTTIAFEHTLIQPFVGDKDDAQPLLKVFAPLETDQNCILREFEIEVSVPVGAVKKGVDWKHLAEEFTGWLCDSKQALPKGKSKHRFSSIVPDLEISIFKTHMPGLKGRLFVMRSDMPEDFPEVIRTALKTKVPKLAAALASKRVLLLEKDSPPHGYPEIAREIERAAAEITELSKIGEIWVVNTVGWEMHGHHSFVPVWPEELRGYSVKGQW